MFSKCILRHETTWWWSDVGGGEMRVRVGGAERSESKGEGADALPVS